MKRFFLVQMNNSWPTQVTFFAWKEKILKNHVFPTYFAFYATVVSATEAGARFGCFDGIRLPRFFDEPEKKAMEKFLSSRSVKSDPKAGKLWSFIDCFIDCSERVIVEKSLVVFFPCSLLDYSPAPGSSGAWPIQIGLLLNLRFILSCIE